MVWKVENYHVIRLSRSGILFLDKAKKTYYFVNLT